ncbi:MAG: SpoIIE family protein phosphatase, partial [bacterium]|nr:SpoIIE family protein phosphatase [bacterium]
TDLRDHRALFRAAPRYAAVVGLAPMAVFSIYAFNGSWSLLLITSMLGAAALGGSTYLFFMTVGSLEYDNEEKAHTLQQAYAQVKNYADRIRSDMDRARAVQQRLLPDLSAMPLEDRLEWAASFVPQDDVSGDYFDVALVSPTRVAVVFADVSGHGLGAALVTAIIKTTFEEWLTRKSELSAFVRLLNRRLFCITPDQSFAAVAVGILDAAQNTFTYCNCGHNPYPYLISIGEAVPRRLDAAQLMILGVFPEIEPEPATIRLKSGDTLLFATDGITEAENELEEEFTTARLEHYLVDNQRLPLKRYVNKLVESVDHFTEGCRQGDDRTMLAVRVR